MTDQQVIEILRARCAWIKANPPPASATHKLDPAYCRKLDKECP